MFFTAYTRISFTSVKNVSITFFFIFIKWGENSNPVLKLPSYYNALENFLTFIIYKILKKMNQLKGVGWFKRYIKSH